MLDMIGHEETAAIAALIGKAEIDIEDALVWTYRHQRVGSTTRKGIYASEVIHVRASRVVDPSRCHLGYGLDSVERVRRNAASQPSREQLAQWATASKPHPDAEVIDEAVRQLAYHCQRLLLQHGKAGTRPDWDLPPEWEPALGWRDSRHQWGIRAELDDKRRYTPIRPTTRSLEQIEHAKQAYLDWHDGLRGAAAALQHAALTRYVVIAPRAPRYPWSCKLDSEVDRVY